MIRVSSVQRCMQSKLVFETPGDNLEDNHLVKLIVYLVNEYKKAKPYLFHNRNYEGKRSPKFNYDLKEMLRLYTFATYRLHRTCRKIESFLSDHNEACMLYHQQ